MRIDDGKMVAAASFFAVAGIALLFFLSETPEKSSAAQALVAEKNSLLLVGGTAQNVSAEKFSLCDSVCVTVRTGGIPSAKLLREGGQAVVRGRVKEYMGRRYIEAEELEVR